MSDEIPLPRILNTAQAARAIDRRPQTLRRWACMGDGPIRPVKIGGRLAWRVEDLRRLLDGELPADPLQA